MKPKILGRMSRFRAEAMRLVGGMDERAWVKVTIRVAQQVPLDL